VVLPAISLLLNSVKREELTRKSQGQTLGVNFSQKKPVITTGKHSCRLINHSTKSGRFDIKLKYPLYFKKNDEK